MKKNVFIMISMCFLIFSSAVRASESNLLTIYHADKGYNFNVLVATTKREQERGLMFYKKLPANRGMIFVYDKPQRVYMWMKNTYIPLDMLFVAANNEIVNIYENAQVLSKDIIDSKYRVKYVIELNAGTVKRLGLQNGDTISFNEQ